MAAIADLERFNEKWESSVKRFQRSIQDAVEKAGYGYDGYGPEIDEDESAFSRWFMYVWQPKRPEDMDYLDMTLYLEVISEDPSSNLFRPVLEVMNNDGSISDDVPLSEPLRLDDDAAWAKVWADGDPLAKDIVDFLEAYSPRPTKRIWRIRGTTPGNVPIHPSIHTHKEVATAEISQRLRRVLDLAYDLLWGIMVAHKKSWVSANLLNFISVSRIYLDQGKPLKALKTYHQFLSALDDAQLELVNKTAGTLDVVLAGGYYGEDQDE